MLNKANAVVCSFFILLSLLFRSTPLYAKDEALPVTNYVNDYAGIMSASAEEQLDELGSALESKTGAQVVIVTTDSLNGADAMKVATDTANEAQLGSSDKDNGVLILVSIDDKQRFMAVGSGLEGDLTDIDCEHLQQDYLVPAFRQGDYEKGLVDLYEQTADHIANAYKVTLNGSKDQNEAPVREEEGSSSFDFSGLLIIGAILLGSTFLMTRRSKNRASASTLHLQPNQRYTLTVPGIDFRTDPVVVGSTDPEIASITPQGVISAKRTGQTVISVQALKDGSTYKYKVIVSRPGGTRRRSGDDDLFDAFLLGSMMGRGSRRRHNGPFDGGGFGGFGGGSSSGGGFSGGGGGFRGGGSGGSW